MGSFVTLWLVSLLGLQRPRQILSNENRKATEQKHEQTGLVYGKCRVFEIIVPGSLTNTSSGLLSRRALPSRKGLRRPVVNAP